MILAKLIYPSYKFLWLNLINYEGKRLFTKFKKGNEENNIIHIDEDKPYAIIRNDKTFFDFTHEISKQINHDLIIKKIEEQNKNHQIPKNNNYYFSIYEYLNIEIKKDIVEFAKSKRNLFIVANYSGNAYYC